MSNVKGPVVPQQPLAPSLQQKEAETVKQQYAEKLSAKDASRLAQQAGFQRGAQVAKKRGEATEAGRSPIPLPDEDLPEEGYDPSAMDQAQENFTLAQGRLEEVAERLQSGQSLGRAVMESSLTPTEGNTRQLQQASERDGGPPDMQQAAHSASSLFNLNLGKDVPAGHKMLAIGLVVGGQASLLQDLKEGNLLKGVQKVMEQSGEAITKAQNRTKGIQLERNVLRTYVPKRVK